MKNEMMTRSEQRLHQLNNQLLNIENMLESASGEAYAQLSHDADKVSEAIRIVTENQNKKRAKV